MPVGMKIYKFDQNKNLLLYRIINSNGTCISLNSNGAKKIIITEKILKDKYIMLTPDAVCNMFTTSAKVEDKDAEDVFIVVHKSDSISANKDMDMIIRQNMFSKSKNVLNILQSQDIYLGDCVTLSNIQPGETMADIMEFDNMKHKFSINLYLDDTIDDIFKCFPKDEQDEFNKVLDNIRKSYSDIKLIKGISKDIKSLFIDNLFMLNYRALFNIIQVDFVVDLGKQSYNSDGNIILNNKQLAKFENIIQKRVKINTILKYDKDLDISKVVTKTHCLISDKNGIIYFISYSVISDIYDDDIAKAFGL